MVKSILTKWEFEAVNCPSPYVCNFWLLSNVRFWNFIWIMWTLIIGSEWSEAPDVRYGNSGTGSRNKCYPLNSGHCAKDACAMPLFTVTFIHCCYVPSSSYTPLYELLLETRDRRWSSGHKDFLNFLDSDQAHFIPGSSSPLGLFHCVLCNAAPKLSFLARRSNGRG
jgi:hypothetical protein